MGRERRVGGRQPAAPPDRFEVDLTSVCVRRGAVQLPYRLKDLFPEGPVAAVDADGGASMDLAFRPPRELAGLRAFFEVHALRANDRMALVFTDTGLRLEAIRRERPARVEGERRSRRAASPPGGGSPGGGEDSTAAAPSSRTDDESAPRSAASQTPPSLRMEVPAASVPAGEAAEPGRAEAGTAQPHWEPLDVLSPDTDGRDAPAWHSRAEPSARTPGSAVVREVRRSPRESSPAEVAAERTAAPVPGGGGEGEGETSGSVGGAQPREVEGSRAAGLFGWGRRLGLRRGDVGRSAGGRSDEGARHAPSAGERGQGPTSTFEPERASGRGRGQPDSGASWQPGSQRGMTGGAGTPAAHASGDHHGPPGADEAEQRVADGHGPDTRAAAVAAAPQRPGEQATVEEDIRAVLSYLAEPDVPAIVRTERVAESLSLSVARVERALDRVSEGSEYLSRIRSGAYMLRRPKQG